MQRTQLIALRPQRVREQPGSTPDPPSERSSNVTVIGSEYCVDLGEEGCHWVNKRRICSCGAANCTAIAAVREYLLSGGKRAPDGLPPTRCPICGSKTSPDPAWNGCGASTLEAGWRCENGGLKHFLDAKAARIHRLQAENPWLIPPAPGYPGVRRDEIMTFEECAAASRKVFEETGYDPTR